MLFWYEIINFEFSIIVFFVRNVGNVVLRKGLYDVKFLNFSVFFQDKLFLQEVYKYNVIVTFGKTGQFVYHVAMII